MDDARASGLERISNQRAVAAERVSLGAHDRHAGASRELDELFESRVESLRLHVVGESPEAVVEPGRVRDRPLERAPQAAKVLHLDVVYPRIRKRGTDRGSIELGVVPRPWDRPNVDKGAYPVGVEHAHELPDRASRVPQGEDDRRRGLFLLHARWKRGGVAVCSRPALPWLGG